MSEENKADMPLLDAFMKAGKISVFESGADLPDHLQDRPFFKLLPEEAISFINAGETVGKLNVRTLKEQAEEPALDTEAHKFFQSLEKRFRTIIPDVTLIVVDPDAVRGRYLMDQKEDRSWKKSLYMHIENKLQKANADKGKTILTDDSVLTLALEGNTTGRNPFSLRSTVSPTENNLAGDGYVGIVIGDNPDSMTANILGVVLGAEERRVKEGITYDEFRRLTVYHELGHATDSNYAGSRNSIERVAQTELDSVMNRHRTECVADAHAVLQLARDFGTTKCAELWGDCRMEYLRMSVENRLEDTKYDYEFTAKVRAAIEKSHAQNPDDPEYENNFKQLMNDKNVADVIKQLGTPLAYHTTDVIDATVKWAKEHLADGSLQKMTDQEVIKQAQIMSETYGLTRQQVAEMSIALAKGETHPKYEQMMERVQESRERMSTDKKSLDRQYEWQKEIRAYRENAKLLGGLGLPVPRPNFSPDLIKELMKKDKKEQIFRNAATAVLNSYQETLIDKLETAGSRKDILQIITAEKEELRAKGQGEKAQKDIFAEYKLKTTDAVIEELPEVETLLAANKSIRSQLDDIKSDTKVSGDDAIIHFIKNELTVTSSLTGALSKAYLRDPAKMDMDAQLTSMRKESADFKKAMIAEKETQIAAAAILADEKTWKKVQGYNGLAQLVQAKAMKKPTKILPLYQLNMGNMTKETALSMFNGVRSTHEYLVKTFGANAAVVSPAKDKDKLIFRSMTEYAEKLGVTQSPTPLNLKSDKIMGTVLLAKKDKVY